MVAPAFVDPEIVSGAFHALSECARFIQQLEMYGLATKGRSTRQSAGFCCICATL